MPHKEFLEKYPLYKKFKTSDIPTYLDQFPEVRINFYCESCRSDQTFIMNNTYSDLRGVAIDTKPEGLVLPLRYGCAHCTSFQRYFFIKVDEDSEYLMKVGQYPAWEITPSKNLKTQLADYIEYYKKGLICESQGYGIGVKVK